MSGAGGPETLPFTYDRSDFAALAKLSKGRILALLFKVVWVLIGLLVLLIGLAAFLGSPVHPKWIAATIGATIAAVLMNRYGTDAAARLQLAVARKAGLVREQRMTITPKAFRAESSRGLTEVNWSAVPRVVREGDHLFVYLLKRTAFIVPRRAFTSDEDFEHFAKAAEERWEQRHRL